MAMNSIADPNHEKWIECPQCGEEFDARLYLGDCPECGTHQ